MNAEIIYMVLFLPVIVFIGIVTSWEDFFTSKIKNKWIVAGLSYTFIVYVLSWGANIFTRQQPGLGFINSVSYHLINNFNIWCINLIIVILSCYLLWHFKVWAAGDAKLFIAYAALIPIGKYSSLYFFGYFASFKLFLWVFIPATAFIVAKSVVFYILKYYKCTVKEIIASLKNSINYSKVLGLVRVIIVCFTMYFVYVLLKKILWKFCPAIPTYNNMFNLAMFLFFWIISKIFVRYFKFIFGILLVTILLLIGVYSFSWFKIEFSIIMRNLLIFALLFTFLEKVVDIYIENTIHKTIPFAHWLFIGALITWFF